MAVRVQAALQSYIIITWPKLLCTRNDLRLWRIVDIKLRWLVCCAQPPVTKSLACWGFGLYE